MQYYCHVSPSVSRDQYTALLLEGVLVTSYGRTSSLYAFWYNFDTVLCQYLETGTSDRCFIGLDQLLRFSGFSLCTLLFFLHSPFEYYSLVDFLFVVYQMFSFIIDREIKNLVHAFQFEK